MKLTMKFAFSLLIGSSVLTLAACDNQEAKTPEKMTALSENKTEAVSVTSEAVKEEIPSPAAKGEAVEKTDKVEAVGKTVEEMGTTADSDGKKDDMAEKKVVRHSEKVRKTATNRYLKEQKALLKVLESQYQQIRCTAEAAKLGENSFCRQEERRLLSEIKRVKGEIRVNQ
ncbi:hypothetical protein [Rodentibacter heidelbergensis]|uniref:Lipoprotein n=1 Tax=Rodentibacter heidelbergensis TaxID=1908258 RepID=A0A1V3I8H1_9PAST|nr:hypothetical protein [Rodentibacter heidelbergensis]OOF36303.1 hypothetical protein BKK48_05985 [Rodentibacter heidelbergensis]